MRHVLRARRLVSSLALSLPLLLAGAAGAFAAEEAAPAGTADVLVLQDGTRLQGTVVAEDDDFVTFSAKGVTRAYARSRVSSLEKGVAAPADKDDRAADAPGDAPAKKAKQADKAQKKKAKSERSALKGKPGTGPLGDAAKGWLEELLARADTERRAGDQRKNRT